MPALNMAQYPRTQDPNEFEDIVLAATNLRFETKAFQRHGRTGQAQCGVELREGMVFTVEPMVNQGTCKVRQEDDGWTVVTNDGRLSAQFVTTVAVTATGVEILTLRKDETLSWQGAA